MFKKLTLMAALLGSVSLTAMAGDSDAAGDAPAPSSLFSSATHTAAEGTSDAPQMPVCYGNIFFGTALDPRRADARERFGSTNAEKGDEDDEDDEESSATPAHAGDAPAPSSLFSSATHTAAEGTSDALLMPVCCGNIFFGTALDPRRADARERFGSTNAKEGEGDDEDDEDDEESSATPAHAGDAPAPSSLFSSATHTAAEGQYADMPTSPPPGRLKRSIACWKGSSIPASAFSADDLDSDSDDEGGVCLWKIPDDIPALALPYNDKATKFMLDYGFYAQLVVEHERGFSELPHTDESVASGVESFSSGVPSAGSDLAEYLERIYQGGIYWFKLPKKQLAIPHSKAPDFIRQFNYYAELTRRLGQSSATAPAPAPVEGASVAERMAAGLLFGAAATATGVGAPATGLVEEGSTAAQPGGNTIYGDHEDDDSEFSKHNRSTAFHKSWALGAFNYKRTGDEEEEDDDDDMPPLEPNPDCISSEGVASGSTSVAAPEEAKEVITVGCGMEQLD